MASCFVSLRGAGLARLRRVPPIGAARTTVIELGTERRSNPPRPWWRRETIGIRAWVVVEGRRLLRSPRNDGREGKEGVQAMLGGWRELIRSQ